jgi:hypothetical protein
METGSAPLQSLDSATTASSRHKQTMLQAWAESLSGVVGGAQAASLQGFQGSDQRFPDLAASDPGAPGSAAPQAGDLNGETLRLPVHVELQRVLADAPRSSTPRVQGVSLDNEAAYTLVQDSGQSAAGQQVNAASPTSLQASTSASSLFGGDTRDAQANDTAGWDRFRNTAAQR